MSWADTGEWFGALALVLGLLMALRLLLLKFGVDAVGKGKRIRVVESQSLGSRARLHLVEVDGQEILIGSGDPGLTALHACGPVVSPAADSKETAEDVPARRAKSRLPWRRLGLITLVLLFAAPAFAQESGAGDLIVQIPDSIETAGGSSILEMLAVLTILGIAPSILLMATSFTRIVIVLAFVRQAIGVQHLPPNQVLVGLALFLTFFVMAPVGEEIGRVAYEPYTAGELTPVDALKAAAAPVRGFLLGHTREEDLSLFVEMSGVAAIEDLDDVPMTTLLPSFLVSELRTAFEIGFVVFLPFLIIDLVVSSMLISMGMIVLPPIVVSLPFKIMLFVLVDGWNLILGSLVRGLA
jgi:flagellar biosynthetic protein FliP